MPTPSQPYEIIKAREAMPSPEELSEIIGLIYDCALDPARWDAALTALTQMFNCHGALLVMFDLTQGRAAFSRSRNIEPHWLRQLDRHAAELAQWKRLYYAPDWPLDEPQANSRNIPADVLAISPVNTQWNAPQGLVDTLQLVLMRSPTRHAQLAMSRRQEAGIITEREMALGRLLLPHIRRAAMIGDVIDLKTIERERAQQTLNALKAGVVVTDGCGRILDANKAALAMLKRGQPVHETGEMLCADDPAATLKLTAAIARAGETGADPVSSAKAVRLTRPGDPPVLAHVLPLEQGDIRASLHPGAKVAIFIGPVSGAAQGAEAMSVAYDLSPMETRLLDGLLQGQKLADAADNLGIAETTARTHLGNIFGKTGVSRQSDLVRRAGEMAAAVA